MTNEEKIILVNSFSKELDRIFDEAHEGDGDVFQFQIMEAFVLLINYDEEKLKTLDK